MVLMLTGGFDAFCFAENLPGVRQAQPPRVVRSLSTTRSVVYRNDRKWWLRYVIIYLANASWIHLTFGREVAQYNTTINYTIFLLTIQIHFYELFRICFE